ncbi:methyltransferase domain-containing protein [Amylibacter sp.]|nr:methyltransferase domain-containing protein [Amylibacter sp.]
MTDKKPNLDLAYALETVQDNRNLYAAWAKDYENDFASTMDYILPNQVAKIFVELGGTGPVLDVGAGTGLAGQALSKLGIHPIDALDLSNAMLEVALEKKIYRNFFTADITQPIVTNNYSYQGIISSGTFTHGHVGPNALDNLIMVAEDGAFFALSINKNHWTEKGFAEKFESLNGVIEKLLLHNVNIYGENSKGEHCNDIGIVATFWKA